VASIVDDFDEPTSGVIAGIFSIASRALAAIGKCRLLAQGGELDPG